MTRFWTRGLLLEALDCDETYLVADGFPPLRLIGVTRTGALAKNERGDIIQVPLRNVVSCTPPQADTP